MTFVYPKLLWLLFVVPPAVMLFLWWAGRTRQRLLTAFIQARLLPDLTVGISRERELIRSILLTLASAALLVALARPQWGFTLEETRVSGLHIIVAIDTSKSMLAEDVAPNRLARAKLAAIDLMQMAKSDRLGLVAFAGGAFLQCPMTIDDAAFRQSVEMLDVNTLPQGGTAISEAIETAAAAFKEGDGHKVLVLMTDGEDQDSNAVEAARKAAEGGMKIFTIGIGSAEGELLAVRDAKGRVEYLKDEAGNAVKSRLNEPLLQQIATSGNGFYLPMRGAKVIESLYQNGLAPLPKTESEAKTFKHYHEQYHWFLGFAILLLIAEILLPARAGAKSTIGSLGTTSAGTAVLLAMLLMPMLVQASSSSALRDYQTGNYDKARTEYERLLLKNADDPRLALNAGTTAIKGGKLSEAETLLTKAVTAQDLKVQQQAYYNRGNARFLTGDSAQEPQAKQEAWENSLKDFESAMKLDAKDTDAKHNYDFVKKMLEELKKQQQQQQDKNQNKSENDDQQKQSDQQQKQDQNKPDQQKSDEQKQQDQKKNQQDQSQQSKQDDKQKEQQKKDQQKADEQKEKEKQEQQKQAQKPKPDDQKNSGEQQQAAAAQPAGQMTPEQAMRVLDTTKGDEQVLPIQMEKPPQTDKKLKDW